MSGNVVFGAPSFANGSQSFSTSNNPNAQPQAPPPAAQPSLPQPNAQLPGIDMSALAGISPDQVALIARLLQSGALPLPPPPPTLATAAGASAQPTLPTAQPATTNQDDVDMDKEEGEIEDGEASGTPISDVAMAQSREVLASQQETTSRTSSRRNTRAEQSTSSPFPHLHPSRHKPRQSLDTGGSIDPLKAKKSQSQDFVLAMHRAGYTYRELAEMVKDPRPLRRMFKNLGLPVSSDHGLSNGTQSVGNSLSKAKSPNVLGKAPVTETQLPTAKPAAPPKASTKTDRTAYLAKLQALKAGKAGTDAGTAQSAVQSLPNTPSASQAAPPVQTQQSLVQAGPSASSSTPTSKAVKTELARQRLEAFKAAQAAKQQALNDMQKTKVAAGAPSNSAAGMSASASPHANLGAGISTIASKAEQEPAVATTQSPVFPTTPSDPLFSFTPPTTSQSFSGLPGLFMYAAPQQASPPASSKPLRTMSQPVAQPVASALHASESKKRTRMSDSPGKITSAKRAFGQSRSASEDESFIIENSDDEDDRDARMDLEPKSATTGAQTAHNGTKHPSQASPSAPELQQGSKAAESGANTPRGMAYEQKLKAIEELNRRIAAKEAAKTQGKSPMPKVDSGTTPSGLPGISTPTQTGFASTDATGSRAPLAATSATLDMPSSVGASNLKQQKEQLRQRIAALENARRPAEVPVQQTDSSMPRLESSIETASAGANDVRGALPTEYAVAPVASGDEVDNTAVEDGELDDDPDFDFYGDEEPAIVSKASLGAEHVGSQATPASAVTDSDALTQKQPVGTGHDAAELGLTDSEAEATDDTVQGMDIVSEQFGESAAQISHVTPTEGLAEDSANVEAIAETAPESSMRASPIAQTQPTPPVSDIAGHDGDSYSDSNEEDSSDSGSSGVDEPSKLPEHIETTAVDPQYETAVLPAYSVTGPGAEDAGLEDVDISDASSTSPSDSDEHNPAIDLETEALVAARPQTAVDDDLASELQPSAEQQVARDQQPGDNKPMGYYTPYESIMTKFKDYRYHPQYLDTVPSGFQSRTYNHQIDAGKPLCPSEMQGEVCQDREWCAGQHYDELGLSDNALLQQMGTKNTPTRTKEEAERWNTGLQALIRTMKAADIRDAATIAARIADYRRQFLGDPSRVITLP